MSAFIPAASFLYQPTEQTPVICSHRRNTPASGTLKLSNKIIRRQIETYLSQYSTALASQLKHQQRWSKSLVQKINKAG